MGHADDRAVELGVGSRLEDGVEDRDGGLGAFEAEPLLADVLGGQELLEGLGGVEALEDVALVVDRQLGGDALDLVLDPPLLRGILDVHVLDADRAAVGVAQHVEDVAEGEALAAGEAAGQELAVEVPDREPVGGRVELDRQLGLLPAQRVEVGDEVAAHAVQRG